MSRLYTPLKAIRIITDDFSDDRRPGEVIGTLSSGKDIRRGIDKEGIISIDNRALRLQFLINPGWAREGIAYGPYRRTNGLAMAIRLLNGHNASQSGYIQQTIPRRILRWLYGGGTEGPLKRITSLLIQNRRSFVVPKIKYWFRHAEKIDELSNLNENLAVGWFRNAIPVNPLLEGNSLVIHSIGPENGELWARIGNTMASVFRGLQNIEVYYFIILRMHGAAYYIASVSGAYGLTGYPNMKPVAVDAINRDGAIYAGVYQCVLGQIGFRVDTRVYGVQIETVSRLSAWYGTAHAADMLIGNKLLNNSVAEIGGHWLMGIGDYALTANGATPLSAECMATLTPEKPSGLVHFNVNISHLTSVISIIWRFKDINNYWILSIESNRCILKVIEEGVWQVIAILDKSILIANQTNYIQLLDDGKMFDLYVNGKSVFDGWQSDQRLADETGVGFGSVNGIHEIYFKAFEAHPREIPIPQELDLGKPWLVRGQRIVLSDDFTGDVQDLAGKNTSMGYAIWRKEMGRGKIELTGNGHARVNATKINPNPGRTVYTVAWNKLEFADLQLTITPPGTARGQGEEGRSGLIFWQDKNNYLIINNWLSNGYGGASVSSFFCWSGFEDIYDAIWTNVGNRISWGVPHLLRVAFDGMNYMVFINDEPVLYRALTDIYPKCKALKIKRIGIVANWEWGNDTGSILRDFIARI